MYYWPDHNLKLSMTYITEAFKIFITHFEANFDVCDLRLSCQPEKAPVS